MDATSALTAFFEAMPLSSLRELISILEKDPDACHEYDVGGRCITAPGRAALRVAHTALRDRQMLQRNRDAIVRELRECAGINPEPQHYGGVNLLSWLGNRNLAWYAVFSYSSPDPREPWFCSLDVEAQRLLLLLVAVAMETEQA